MPWYSELQDIQNLAKHESFLLSDMMLPYDALQFSVCKHKKVVIRSRDFTNSYHQYSLIIID